MQFVLNLTFKNNQIINYNIFVFIYLNFEQLVNIEYF